MAFGPLRLGAYCGCSDSREVRKSFSSIPAPFSASSTLPIAALLASEASRAVLASVLTPASICAVSGGTDTVPSPVTEIAETGASSASTGTAGTAATSAAMTGSVTLSIRHARNRVRNRNRPSCHIRMQPLHHLAIELYSTSCGIFRPLEGGDDLSRMRAFLRRRGEDGVARLDLARMDQRLAVEAEVAALRAFLRKALGIAEIAVGTVENLEPVQARGENAMRDHRQHRGAARLHADPGFARDIVGTEHEAGQPHLGIPRGGREFLGV